MRITMLGDPHNEGLQVTVIEVFDAEVVLLSKEGRKEFHRLVLEAMSNKPASYLRALLVLAEELQKNDPEHTAH